MRYELGPRDAACDSGVGDATDGDMEPAQGMEKKSDDAAATGSCVPRSLETGPAC